MSRALLVLGCGFAVPLLMTAAYFAMNQSLEVLLWTTFVWPRRVVAALGHTSLQQLIDGHRYFLWAFGPSLALASINFVPGVSRRVDPLNRDLLLWVICGLAVIQVQVRSWYSWHYLMLMVPLGILAARCVDSLWHYAAEQYGQQHRWRLAFHLTLAVLFLYLGHVYKLTIDTALLVRQGLPTTLAKIGEIRKNSSNAYARIANEVSFFAEAPARPGGVYVFCGASHQHLYSLLSGREPMVIYATSSPLVLPEKQDWLLERLRCSRPGYILVPRENQPFVDQEFPAFQSFLGSYYRPYRESAAGIWYISLE